MRLFRFLTKKPIETYKSIDGKVVLVKEWPCKEDKENSWGRSGYDSLYK